MKKRLLSLLCAVMLLFSIIPAAAVSAATGAEVGVGSDLPWTEEQTLLEQILERDGFLEGIWYPWLNSGSSGHNLTGNDLMAKYHGETWARVELDYYGADNVYREIYNLKAMGYNMMAWGGSIYGEGVIFDDNGDVLGIKQEYLDNARRLLDICREVGMPVLWNVYFHSDSAVEYYSHHTWAILAQMIGNPEVADHYAERFVAPLCEMLAEYPDVVAMVSIADEPENEINDADEGSHFGGRSMYGVNQDDMFYFMGRINDVVKEKLPNVPRTVASNFENKAPYAGFDLDLMGHNRYDNVGDPPATENYITYSDIILMEYNVGDEFPGDDVDLANTLITYRENMIKQGYKGGFQWCWMPNSVPGPAYYLLYSRYDNTAFRETVTLLRQYMDDYRAEYRGETVVLDAPVLYANDGTGKVKWIPSPQATSMDLLRSDDGGVTWKAILKDVNQNDYLVRGTGTYTDTDTTKPKSGFMYKIVVRDDAGNTVESAPNDPAGTDKTFKVSYTFSGVDYPTNIEYEACVLTKDQADLLSFGVTNNRPYLEEDNMLTNGSFESTTGGQWNNRSFLNSSVQVMTDPTAPEGKKSLYFNTTGTTEGAWYKFTVTGLQKNTDYVFSTWVKGAYLSDTNAGRASIGVIDPDTDKFMVYWEYYRDYARASRLTQQIYPNAWDDDWHLRSVMFNTGDLTSYEIALYGYGTEMWVDDMALYENGKGVKYSSGRNDGVATKWLWDDTSCAPADSYIADVTVDDKAYWTAGEGWKQGFMSIQESRYGYGNALKYTASSNPHGLYYLKWFDVDTNTKYHFSFDFKILESGSGRIIMMDSKMTKPGEFCAIDLDADVYGTDWFSYSGEFNSGMHDKLAFGICDLGGSVLIDNIRVYKATDSNAAVKDLYTYTNKVTNNVGYNQIASVTARAEGDGLKYQWYYKNKGASKFSLTTSITGKTYSVAMNESRDGRQVYCVVTDKYGVSRRTATTTLTMVRKPLKLTSQPATAAYANLGATTKVTIKASGDGLKYTWYYRNATSTKYSKSSVTTNVYSVAMSEKVHGRRLYCVVTDAYGNKVQTKTFILRCKASIATQPANVTVAKNKIAKTTVKAVGDGLTYKWYIKNPGSSKYTLSSVKSATYSCTMTSKTNGRRAICYVYDKYGNKVQSKTVILKMK